MLLTLVDLLIVALATNQVIEIWRHSELFRERRFQIQIMKEGFESQSTMNWLDRIIYWWCRLMLCNWCLSVWMGMLVAVAYLSAIAGTGLAAMTVRAAVLTFAISRFANLINDVLYPWCRTPKYDTIPPIDETKGPEAETNDQDRGTSGLFPGNSAQLQYYEFHEPQEVCPFCKSDDIANEDGPDHFKNLAVTCHACGKQWIEPDVPDKPAVTEGVSIQYDDETQKSGTITIPDGSVNIYTNQPYDKNSTKPGPGRDGHG